MNQITCKGLHLRTLHPFTPKKLILQINNWKEGFLLQLSMKKKMSILIDFKLDRRRLWMPPLKTPIMLQHLRQDGVPKPGW